VIDISEKSENIVYLNHGYSGYDEKMNFMSVFFDRY